MMKPTLLHSFRFAVGGAVLGAAVAGTFFAWAPLLGILGVHEVGGLVGMVLGATASAKRIV